MSLETASVEDESETDLLVWRPAVLYRRRFEDTRLFKNPQSDCNDPAPPARKPAVCFLTAEPVMWPRWRQGLPRRGSCGGECFLNLILGHQTASVQSSDGDVLSFLCSCQRTQILHEVLTVSRKSAETQKFITELK